MFIEKKMGGTTCAILIILGVIFLFFPKFSLSFIGVLVGIGILVAAIGAFTTWSKGLRGTPASTATLIFAILLLIFALICLFHPLAFSTTISWLIAFIILVTGIAQTVTIISLGDFKGRALTLVVSILDALFGLCALIWPSMLIQFVGIAFILEGIDLLILTIKSQPIDVDPL
ncbi:MAG: HdeD family acid-resistance protein [Coriobacteriales bacterium]|jgi:uncharacterized membrane protein HdeD (DUF308 family)